MSDADLAFAAPDEAPSLRSPLDTTSAVVFLVSGTLLAMWALWSVLGVLTGGLMSVAMVATGDEELLMGLPILLIYGLWLVVCGIVGPLQLVAGIQMLRRRASRPLRWAATFGGLASVLTVYCAMPAMLSFGLGLASLLSEE